ncbi:MAG: type II toxin-antitoxin system HicB family antitoxin [Anaerolineales bacterium]|nr:type II toxin-antitoxin system HicB family antitoxin [Anaerolineales bacterium]
MENKFDYYLGQSYTIELTHDAEAGWFANVKELPGCMSEGDTAEEALQMVQEAKELWLEVALEDGDDIPVGKRWFENDLKKRWIVKICFPHTVLLLG